ncbi:MAG: DUF2723 domain-containing protein [Anaerolineae bacterium]|nr:DUF2723 domain-containing protein [Anaerolineae bacterium]MDW8071306.1 DUF2723 domain-containing protein [Anaerolineae bacterium]
MGRFPGSPVAPEGIPASAGLAPGDKWAAGILAGLSAALYVRTCAPSVLFGDSGEFQFVPYILGIAHPTGYPLYVLLGWVWSHLLPWGDVAYRMNLFSGFWAALTVGMGFLLVRRFLTYVLGGGDRFITRVAAGIASAAFAVSPTFWGQAVIAEVYTLHTFFVVLVLFLFLDWLQAPLHGGRRIALALTFGLALSHHRTALALLPGMVGCFLLSRWQRVADTSAAPSRAPFPWRAGLMGLAGVLAPWLLYLYLPLRAPHVPYATLSLSPQQPLVLYANTAQGLWAHISGAVFVENLRLGSWPTAEEWMPRLATAAVGLRDQFGLVGIALALVGLARLVWMRRWPWLALTGFSYAAGVLFNLLYDIGDIAVLYVPSYLLVTLWLGLGLVTLAQAVARVSTRRVGYGVLGCSLALPLWLGMQHFPQVDRSADVAAEAMWRPILERPIPSGAVLVSNDRDEMMPLWYYQYVAGRRRDLLGLFPRIVAAPTYRDIGGLLDQALASGRPVFLVKAMPGLEVKVRLERRAALAPLVRVVGPAAAPPPAHRVDARLDDRMRLIGYTLTPGRVRAGDTVTLRLYWQPLQPLPHDYTSYVHVVDAQGNRIAQSDHRPGGVYYPTSLWKPGEQLCDVHTMTWPSTGQAGIYQIWTGMYRYPSMEPLGAAVRIGSVAVTP